MIMKNTKDLSWLGAPTFILIIGMIFFSAKKQNAKPHVEETKYGISVAVKNVPVKSLK
jgi:hypothetical protein